MKRNYSYILGGGLLVLLLAAAAFMAPRLLRLRQSGSPLLGSLISGGAASQGKPLKNIQLNQTRATEVPERSPDLSGQVTVVQDNSIQVMQMSKGSAISGQGGVTMEVVVTEQTLIYRDTSLDNIPKPGAGQTTLQLQQVVEPVGLDQVVQGTILQVWGQKRGDRLIADEIVLRGTLVVDPKR